MLTWEWNVLFIRTFLIHKGIGKEVSHEELTTIASPGDSYTPAYVFSVDNFGALNTLLRRLVESTCPNCTKAELSDVMFFIDGRENGMTEQEFQTAIHSVSNIVERMAAYGTSTGQKVSIYLLGATGNPFLPFHTDLRKEELLVYINTLRRDDSETCLGVKCDVINETFGDSLQFVIDNYFNESVGSRSEARKFMVVATSGRFISSENINTRDLSQISKTRNVTVLVLGPGYDVNMDGLDSLVTNPSNVFVTRDDQDLAHLDVLQSQFTYVNCDGI